MNDAKCNTATPDVNSIHAAVMKALSSNFDPTIDPVFDPAECRAECAVLAEAMLDYIGRGAPAEQLAQFTTAAVHLAILVRASETYRNAADAEAIA